VSAPAAPAPTQAVGSPIGSPPAPARTAPGQDSSKRTTWIAFLVSLIALGVVLVVQVPTIRTQMRFRTLKRGMALPTPNADATAVEALRSEGRSLLPTLAEELEVGGTDSDAYRILLVGKLLAPMEGEEASLVLIAMTKDISPAVRVNVYTQLSARVDAGLIDRGRVVECLASRWHQEQDLVARGFAANALVRVGDERGLWPLLLALRHLPPHAAHAAPIFVETLKKALGPQIQLDQRAAPEIQIRQMIAIEEAYQAKGGKIPPGQDLETMLKKQSSGSANRGPGQ
jgi:hypothetical protein